MKVAAQNFSINIVVDFAANKLHKLVIVGFYHVVAEELFAGARYTSYFDSMFLHACPDPVETIVRHIGDSDNHFFRSIAPDDRIQFFTGVINRHIVNVNTA